MTWLDRGERSTLSQFILFSPLTKIECIRIPESNKPEPDLQVREEHLLAPESELGEAPAWAILQLPLENIETPHPKFPPIPLAAPPDRWAYFCS
jgi:hypothetical protein